MCKRIMQVLFSICLITSFYSANGMVLSPASVGMLVKPFAKVVSYGSKIAFLGAKIGAGMAVSVSQFLLKKCRIVLCKAKYGINSLEYAQMLIDYGYDDEINKVDKFGRTPLYLACYKGNLDIVQLLLPRCTDATINKVNDRGTTPLYWACKNGNLAMVQLLLPKCTDATINKAGFIPLHQACFDGNLDIVQLLLPRCTDATVNKADNNDQTPLYWACCNGNLDIVQLLLPRCTDATVNKADIDGWTPLSWACNSDPAIVKLLLEHGVDVDQIALREAQNQQNNLPNRTEILRLLNLAQAYDGNENKTVFLEAQAGDDYILLKGRHLRYLKKQKTGFSRKNKTETDCVIRTVKN